MASENTDDGVMLPERRDSLKLLLQGALGIAAPGLFAGGAVAQQDPLLRLGYQFHLWGAPAVVGLRRDFFAAEGVRVDGRRFASGADARNAMIARSVDVATVGMTPFVLGASLGNMIGIATVCYAGRTGAVMAGTKTGITSVAGLKGKRIASQVGSTLDNVFKQRIAPAAGLGPNDYSIANVQFSDQVAALAAGSVDAFLGLEPFCAISEHRKLAVQLTDYYKYDIIPNMLAVNTEYANKNPEILVAFLRGWLKAVDLFKQSPAEVNQVMLTVYRESGYDVPPEVVQRVLDRLIVNPNFIPELYASMKLESESLLKAGRIKQMPIPEKVLDDRFLKRAAQKS
jgi:ABC-type nitrate/sulfonate/bicarbonate transport system substrate-binding protein